MASSTAPAPTRPAAPTTRSGATATADATAARPAVPSHRAVRISLAALRALLAWTFLWPFLDKLFGLGFATPSEKSVLNGGSPTEGFLFHGTKGPFAHAFDSVAGAWWLDLLFMLGLLGVGLAFALGIGMRAATAACALMMASMWLVTLQPATNPITDDHWMIALAAVVLTVCRAGDHFGLGAAWRRTPLVRRFGLLA
ncbi:hypothetical protein [Streptomyces sp. NPDC097619]|uniref:hypothetical protein n=1 Tax=Streptomyces sp. NPDC097619 TaxID=3157228 RepID=UPI003330A961